MDDVPWKWDLIDQTLDIRERLIRRPESPGLGREHRGSGGRGHPLGQHQRPEFLSALEA